MPVAIRAALVSCWKSVSFMAAHLCMHPGWVQGLDVNWGADLAGKGPIPPWGYLPGAVNPPQGLAALPCSAPIHGVIETRILSRLPGSSGRRERYLVPL